MKGVSKIISSILSLVAYEKYQYKNNKNMNPPLSFIRDQSKINDAFLSKLS